MRIRILPNIYRKIDSCIYSFTTCPTLTDTSNFIVKILLYFLWLPYYLDVQMFVSPCQNILKLVYWSCRYLEYCSCGRLVQKSDIPCVFLGLWLQTDGRRSSANYLRWRFSQWERRCYSSAVLIGWIDLQYQMCDSQ